MVTAMLLLGGAAGSAENTGGALGSTWADAAKMPDFFTGMWMTFAAMVESDPKMNIPYTAKAQQYVDSYKHLLDIPYAQEGCQTPGLPIGMRSGPIKFAYSPGLLSIYMQGVGDTRFIRMNQPMGKTSPKFYGNSVGHFEGDTLVVETADFLPEISFQYGVGKGPPGYEIGASRGGGPGGGPPGGGAARGGGPGGGPPGGGAPRGGGPGGPDANFAGAIPRAIWGPHGEGMRMVERMRLVDPMTMEYKLTLYDDTVWTQPYVSATRTYSRMQKGVSERGPFTGEVEEWVCTISITSFDPDSNTYKDMDPSKVVEFLDKLGR
jgi:hypothetical protein